MQRMAHISSLEAQVDLQLLCNLVLHFLSLQDKKTALHLAIESGHDKVCQVLLQAGADVQATDRVSTIIVILFTLVTV